MSDDDEDEGTQYDVTVFNSKNVDRTPFFFYRVQGYTDLHVAAAVK